MGGFSGTVDPSFTQSSMEIDYVRVYQNTLSNSEINETIFKIFPNPAKKIFSISEREKINTLEIFSIQGKKVFETEKPTDTIDVSHFAEGLYVLKIQTANTIVSKKIIIK